MPLPKPLLLKATKEHKEVLQNLMQFYIYDFSEFMQIEVEDNGQFAPYADLLNYYEECNNKYAYMVKHANKYAGFVLVKLINTLNHNYFSIAEFFILKKYRRQGIGKAIAKEVFDLHRGQWQVFQRINNQPAQNFWLNVITDYTNANFKERFEGDKRIQVFEN